MRYLLFILLLLCVGCEPPMGPEPPEEIENPGDEDPDEDQDEDPDEVPDVIFDPLTGDSLVVDKAGIVGDGSFGDLAFRAECGTCHASRDGFDVAFFNFSDEDIVRRGLDHVDSTTVLAIRDYIRSIQTNLTPVDRATQLFRPGTQRLSDDVAFAVTLFGADAWPRNLTIEELQQIDPRDVSLSVPFPTWSSERTENDWMPETPLPEAILSDQGDLVRQRLVSYYASRSDAALRQLVDDFERVATQEGFSCEGSPGFHPRPLMCFEARRWMASLTAIHLVQQAQTRTVPEYIADLWWRVGEAAVSWSLGPGNPPSTAERNRRRRIANSWLTISWIYDPARVGDNTAYFSEFTKHTNERRQVALAYAYWLTTDPTAGDGVQMYDVMLQMMVPGRLPQHWFLDYANWMLDVIDTLIDRGHVPRTPEAFDLVLAIIDNTVSALDLNPGGNPDMPLPNVSEIKARLADLAERVEGLR